MPSKFFVRDPLKLQNQITDSAVVILPKTDTSLNEFQGIKQDSLDSLSVKSSSPASLFKGSEHIVHEVAPVSHTRVDNDWITVHLVIVMAMIAWVRIYYRKRFHQVLLSFFGQHYQSILYREGNIFRERISIPLLLNYLITYSIFIYLFVLDYLKYDHNNYHGFKLFALIILILLLVWIVKNLSILVSGYIFKNPVVLSDYIVTQFVFNVNTGIYIFPVVILATFVSADFAIELGIVFLIIVFIYRIFRQFFTGIEYSKFSLFNRLLYLCTFEIIPNLVLIKLILNNLK